MLAYQKINEIKGFHGTSYDFNRFNHKKYLDTGDGSQEFGWGTYVTDNKDIAGEYAERSKEANTGSYDKNNERITTERLTSIANETITNDAIAQDVINSLRMIMYTTKTIDANTLESEKNKFISKYSEDSNEINSFFNNLSELNPHLSKAKSYVYEVEIPENDGSNYIEWFNPINNEVKTKIVKGLNFLNTKYHNRFEGITEGIIEGTSNGKELYGRLVELLGSPKAASLFLLNMCNIDGIVYPIGTVFGFDGKEGNNYVIFNASSVKINNKIVSESKVMNLNEWKPSFFDQLPEKIKLYHGTDIMALNDIIEEGKICALHGHKRSETYGVNWFNTQLTNNFGHGSNFSIEVPKSDFINGKFKFMNNTDVTSWDNEIPIDGYNFRIERIGGFNEETFRNLFERVNGDIFEWVNKLNKINHEFNEYMMTVEYPVVMYLIKQLFGDEVLRKEGIIESKLYINEMDAEDVSLSSFKTKEELHDRFWINEKLNSRVREKLLDIADDFIDELAIPNFKPKDIVFTGSLANYNWSRYSDIDVHIVVSFKDIYKKVDLIDDYFKSKKEIWNQTHEKLKIYGYPVEISVENADEPGVSSGVYSLIKNKWVTEPSNFDDAKLNEKYIKEFSAEIMNEIDEIEKRIEKETSNSRLEELGEKTMKIFKRLKNMRKEGLARSGEMSSGNIIYKLLRRMNYLDKIWDIINNTYNKINSIK